MGRCVIVGRGANFILPAPTTLRVRLVASREDRVRAMAHRLGLPAREAAAWVERTERERAEFVRRYFGQDTADPHHYDLVLNMSRLSVEEAADVVVQTLRRFEGRESPAGRKREAATA
jgi:cytidylate kinase